MEDSNCPALVSYTFSLSSIEDQSYTLRDIERRSTGLHDMDPLRGRPAFSRCIAMDNPPS